MGLHLSSGDQRNLRTAICTLLSPLDYPDTDEWRLQSLRAVQSLIDADGACFGLALDARPHFLCEPERQAAGDAFEQRYARLDGGLNQRRRAAGLEVFHASMLYDMDAFRRTEFWNDYVVPYRLFDTVALLSDVGPGASPAGFICHHEQPAPPRPFGERELALLKLLAPALKSGVAACVELHERRNWVVEAIDSVSDPALLCDARGRIVHANPAFTRTLERDPLPEKLLWASRMAARDLARLLRRDEAAETVPGAARGVYRQVRTPAAIYRLRANLLRVKAEEQGLALVILEPSDPVWPSEEALQDRFGLSPRQARVALSLAERKTNAEIATELGISPHTARHHTEQVLLRLDIRSRTEVQARILAS